MADYWKSQPRHHCDFCKCWIADNKPSRDFHEKGKKHQVNVEKKIAEVRKKGIKKAEKEEEENSTLKQIEKAALKALQEDLKRDPSLASRYGVEIKETALEKLNPSKPAQVAPKTSRAITSTVPQYAIPIAEPQPEPLPDQSPVEETQQMPVEAIVKDWQEAKSPEGYTYYWNTVTNEVTWTKPEGYVSPEEGQNGTEDTTSQETEQASTSEQEEVTSTTEPAVPSEQPELPDVAEDTAVPEPGDITVIPLPNDIASIPLPGEENETKEENPEEEEKRKEDENDVPEPVVPRPERRQRKPNPYGSWETVEDKEEEYVDLQLPEQKEVQIAKVIPLSEPKIKFREKKVDTLGAELVAFKKRKLNTATLKLRKREEDS